MELYGGDGEWDEGLEREAEIYVAGDMPTVGGAWFSTGRRHE